MTVDFEAFDLHPELMQAIDKLGYETPTPIQASAIPALMTGNDVLGQAQTGTGKTAAFALPMLNALKEENIGVQGLIIAPTRELAIQDAKAVEEYARYRNVKVLAIYGGQAYGPQINSLKRGVDIVVGTPGRMLDLIRKGMLDLSAVRYLVLDEADEMLSMGFIEDIEAILEETPENRQTALFSATLPKPIRQLANRYMIKPEQISVSPEKLTVDKIEQRYYMVNQSDKLAALNRLLEIEDITSVLIFTRTRVGASKLADELFGRGIPAEALHGDMSQVARETVMRRFRMGKILILVATDVAARGLDIDDVSHVINYDIPFDPEIYVHRIGRTGRAGKTGVAITLATPRERRRMQKIESFTMQPIERAEIPSTEDIITHREALFLGKMQKELANTEESTRELVTKLSSMGYDPMDIAAAAIRMLRAEERNRSIEEIEKVDLRSRPAPKRNRREPRDRGPRRSSNKGRSTGVESGMVRFSMNVGKAHGIRPGDVVGAIASEANIPGKAIGAIDIQKSETFVDVEEKHANSVQHKVRRCRMRGHWATVNRT